MTQTQLGIPSSFRFAALVGNEALCVLKLRDIFRCGSSDAEEFVDSFLTSWLSDVFGCRV